MGGTETMKPYWSNGRVVLYQGDNLDVFPLLEDESVDTVITDPPYGLKFMGKEWDHGVPGMAYWAECLRVAKPGAMLCAFGGSRTHHRLMCAIEDAGWEIRDVLMWLYGSGFPKSHSVGKAIDKVNGEVGRLLKFTSWMRSTGTTARQLDEATGTNMGGHYLTAKSQPAIPTTELWAKIRPLCDAVPDWVDELVERIEAEREVVGERQKLQSYGNGVNQVYGGGPDKGGIQTITSPATDAAALWDGYGTALKPAYEPIILAMKPLPGTFAQNALEYGVAGLWVDGCRVGMANGDQKGQFGHHRPQYLECETTSGIYGNGFRRAEADDTQGRWPANLLLSHAPGCECVGVRKVGSGKAIYNSSDEITPSADGYCRPNASMYTHKLEGQLRNHGTETVEAWNCVPECPVRLLDEQSGERAGSKLGTKYNTPRRVSPVYNGGGWHDGTENQTEFGYGDTGGASRFFTRFHYSAKASRSERELGLLGHIPCLKCGLLDSVTHMNPKTGKEEKCRRNGHPTVKPLDVCRWLCRLTRTPTGGVVLDPFMGSGRIPMAAILEGRDTIGIELERPSFEIAQAAVRWAEQEQQELEPEIEQMGLL